MHTDSQRSTLIVSKDPKGTASYTFYFLFLQMKSAVGCTKLLLIVLQQREKNVHCEKLEKGQIDVKYLLISLHVHLKKAKRCLQTLKTVDL